MKDKCFEDKVHHSFGKTYGWRLLLVDPIELSVRATSDLDDLPRTSVVLRAQPVGLGYWFVDIQPATSMHGAGVETWNEVMEMG